MKLQITISDQEEKWLAQGAAVMGYDVTKYAKFVLGREAFEQSVSEKEMKDLVKDALEEHKNGKTTTLTNDKEIENYLKPLG